MGTGTTNLKSTSGTGDVVAPELANDLCTLAARADDESLYDLIDLEPPAGASATNVNVGYIPLRGGPLVAEDALDRLVWIAPSRWCRSSISTVTPRRMLSGTIDTLTSMALPTIAPAGKWRIELLYAQLAYVNPTDPTKGTQVTLHWATSPADANLGSAAAVATLPANTSTTWNIPVSYVKNIAAATRTYAHDILSPTPSTSGGLDGKLRRRLGPGPGALDARRGYSSSVQSLATLAAANEIKDTLTPAKAHKADSEVVIRTFNIPASMTGASGGVVYTDLDDTRDWRNGTFISFWNVACLNGTVFPPYLGEEDAATGISTTRQAPTNDSFAATYPAQYMHFGQSFEPDPAWTPKFRVARVGVTGTWGAAPLQGTPYFEANATDSVALVVSSGGVLQLRRDITAAVAGGPISIFLIATFPNSR